MYNNHSDYFMIRYHSLSTNKLNLYSEISVTMLLPAVTLEIAKREILINKES